MQETLRSGSYRPHLFQYYRRWSTDLSETSESFALKKKLIGDPATPEELMALEGGSHEVYYKAWDLFSSTKAKILHMWQNSIQRFPKPSKTSAIQACGNTCKPLY